MKKHRDPDRNLAVEAFPDLNREFYASSPVAYFSYRLHSIFLAAGARTQLDELLETGVHVDGLDVAEAEEEHLDPEVHEAAVLADAAVLVHHAAETLLRLFLAHRDGAPCPPLEIARARLPGEFKQRVEEEISQASIEDLRSSVARTLLGSDIGPGLTSSMARGIDNYSGWLKHFAQLWLAEAALYNAAKHGFVLAPGEASFEMRVEEDEDANLGRSGPAIGYLEIRPDAEGQARWHHTMKFFDRAWLLTACHMATSMMDQIWRVAAHRYTGADLGTLGTPAQSFDDVRQHFLSKQDDELIVLESMSVRLAYYVDPSAITNGP